ncbi:hypothetical protein EDB89DRAFT_1826354, partial [Lactarius sanguifluus]
CPRRASSTSTNPASKLIQDEWYPNHTWAKLQGLPMRKIGRCKRALGETLGWRPWV